MSVDPYVQISTRRLRKLGWPMVTAYRAALVSDIFADLESAGQVRFRVVPDCDASIEDLAGDMVTPRQLDEIRARAYSDGVWGIIGEFRHGNRWIPAESCWGFIGDSWEDSGYDTDIRAATIAALNEHRYTPTYCAGERSEGACT